MQDDPTVFLKRIVTITLVLALILAGILYFSRPDADTEVASDTQDSSQQGIYQEDIDKAASGGTSASGNSVKRSIPRSSSVTLTSDLIKKAEQTASMIVYYDSTGFRPAEFFVKAGTSVRFINRSGLSLRVSSVVQNGAPIYPEFDQVRSVGQGGYYDFNFSKAGSWSFTNQSAPQHFGIVTVIQ
ncbi:hypothetical protein K8Q93_01660 [Candidatus Parcubacteria bacterium]|nr:hypothetical protein [Candidatus Parcubacteria bacterium]